MAHDDTSSAPSHDASPTPDDAVVATPDDIPGVRFAVEGPVATVTLARPEIRNAQLPGTWRAMARFAETIEDAVRVVVVRGEGASFSAGLDRHMFGVGVPGEPSLRDLAALPRRELVARIADFQDGFRWLHDPRFVSIAAVQGHAVGAGLLALACDLRVLADDAMLAMRETSLGLVPDLGGTHPLVRTVGYSRALEICVTGRWIDAAEASELGLATVVVPRPALDSTVRDLVAAVLEPPAESVRALSWLLDQAAVNSRDAQLVAESRAQVGLLSDLGRSDSDA